MQWGGSMETPIKDSLVTIKPKIRQKSECSSFICAKKFLDGRKENTVGKYCGFFPLTNKEIWCIEHDDGIRAAYLYDEVH